MTVTVILMTLLVLLRGYEKPMLAQAPPTGKSNRVVAAGMPRMPDFAMMHAFRTRHAAISR